jgi:hypothetical protein
MLKSMLEPLPEGARRLAEDRLRKAGHLAPDAPLEAAFDGLPGCMMGGAGCGMGCSFACETGLSRMLAMAGSERAQANAVIALHRRMQGGMMMGGF